MSHDIFSLLIPHIQATKATEKAAFVMPERTLVNINSVACIRR